MKKIIALALAVILVLGLAGGGGDILTVPAQLFAGILEAFLCGTPAGAALHYADEGRLDFGILFFCLCGAARFLAAALHGF